MIHYNNIKYYTKRNSVEGLRLLTSNRRHFPSLRVSEVTPFRCPFRKDRDVARRRLNRGSVSLTLSYLPRDTLAYYWQTSGTLAPMRAKGGMWLGVRVAPTESLCPLEGLERGGFRAGRRNHYG